MSAAPAAALEAVADDLFATGQAHGWWPKGSATDWRALEPKAKAEFLAIVEQMLKKYEPK